MNQDPFEPLVKVGRPRWQTIVIWTVFVPAGVLSLFALASFVYMLGFEHY